MRIVFASGKGGAGKTTVAASLAVIWPDPCMMVDADVEAPNLHLFLRPQLGAPESVFLPVPELNREKCTACGACGEMCACDILESFSISQSTLSYHMRILAESGLVLAVREGAWMRYTLNKAKTEAALSFFSGITRDKEDCICNQHHA